MKCKFKMGVAFLLILVMLVPLSVGCGGGGGGGKRIIHIGLLTDFTGAAAPAVKYMTYIEQDMIRYYNDENLIPGVKVELDAYDTQFNPARYSLGYEWCKDKGARVIITTTSDMAELVKPFAERDKIVIDALGATDATFVTPGWVFCFSTTVTQGSRILLHWVSENDWKGQGTPKIGLLGWNDTMSEDAGNAIDAYLKAHPEEYDYVDRITTVAGTTTFTAEARKLKDEGCDYVGVLSGMMEAALLRDLRAAGSKATMIDCLESMGSWQKMYSQLVGWDMLDGCYSASQSYGWTDSSPIVQLATTMVHRYHSEAEAQDIISSGTGYVGPAAMLTGMLEVLQQAVKNVGAENFNGQAYYDAAINYKTTSDMWKGYYPEFSFSESNHRLIPYALITQFKKDAETAVTVSDWLPAVD